MKFGQVPLDGRPPEPRARGPRAAQGEAGGAARPGAAGARSRTWSASCARTGASRRRACSPSSIPRPSRPPPSARSTAASTKDGRDVAIKVQYPGIVEAVDADLRAARALVPLIKRLSPGLDGKALVNELRERVSEELDYELEAQNGRRVARHWRDHPHVLVPRVDTELSTRRVLVSDWVDGDGFAVMKAARGRRARPPGRDDLPLLLRRRARDGPRPRRPAPRQPHAQQGRRPARRAGLRPRPLAATPATSTARRASTGRSTRRTRARSPRRSASWAT